ncbi:CLUMA_CG015408, isoform A [Clunio marinus]|uniref:mannose-6-phosphate isomerase n=1 Tax=Clunio marinus TaxID=568069 RepID=A0A1J1ISZ7_9DIPT|nr:CLUMA_CG015408, isoform A [Clunio marinus]
MEIIGDIKNYDWGKLGSESEVVKLMQSGDETFIVDEAKPYSELWMGDHVSGQSKIKGTGEMLGEFIQRDCDNIIGGQSKLPFLFKVLSIRKALSIQVHPNKTEAELLHAKYPDIYKDANHKPEIAIALTPFLALCGFRPHSEIYNLLKFHTELCELLDVDNIELINTNGTEGLKTCYTKLMKSNDENIRKCINGLMIKFENDDSKLAVVFRQIQKDFPYDVGSLSLFFLNLIELHPGESIFLAAKVPHAYLSGDCIECMSCSDNVVRAGLTPKFKDVENLLGMLIYDGSPAKEKLFQPEILDRNHKFTWIFKPPVKDFAVAKIHVPSIINSYEIINSKFGSIILVVSGEAEMCGTEMESFMLKRGKIIFLPSKVGPVIKLSNINHDFICYQAMYNDF